MSGALWLSTIMFGLRTILTDFLGWMRGLSGDLIHTSLRIEDGTVFGGSVIPADLIENLFWVLYGIAMGLLLLKFLWKGFEIYVLWRDGDSDVSPHHMIVGMMMAVVCCAVFPYCYNAAVDVTEYAGSAIMEQVDTLFHGVDTDLFDQAMARQWLDYLGGRDANGDGVISVEEVLAYYDTDGDGELSKAEMVVMLDKNGNGRIDQVEWETFTRFADWLRDADPSEVEEAYYKDCFQAGLAEAAKYEQTMDDLSLFSILLVLVYFIAYMIMWCKLVGRGVEMLFLRIGLPLAAIGLVDSDGGMFHNYVLIMLRQMITSVFQVAAMRLSILVMVDLSIGSIAVGIAMLLAAFRTPKLLEQLMSPQSRGSGVVQKVYSAVATLRLIRK